VLYLNQNSERFRDLFPSGTDKMDTGEVLAALKVKAQTDGYARLVYQTLLSSVALARTYKAVKEGKDPAQVSLKDLGLDSLPSKQARLGKLLLKAQR
jgi:hypothetical protein